MDQETDNKSVKILLKDLLSSMKKVKKQLLKENDWFETRGVVGFSKSGDLIASQLESFHNNYEKLKKAKESDEKIPGLELKIAEKEYDELIPIIKEYHLNLRAASKVSEIFLTSAKNSLENTAKMEHGYNKEGVFISDKKILANIPSMAFNNKV